MPTKQDMRKAVMSGKDKIFKNKFAKKFQRQQPLLTESSVITKESVESKIRSQASNSILPVL